VQRYSGETAAGADIDEAVKRAAAADNIVVAVFASVAAYRGSTALAGEYPRLVEALTASGKPVAFVALGNPYLLRNFPKVNAYLATCSTVPPSEVAAVRALFGEIAISGHLPVSILGIAKAGDGIMVPALTAPAQSAAPSVP
jgi:beta-N-acetylhexosaminidase